MPKYELPDPLVCFDGRKVADVAMWRETRRPEILRAFAQNVYGRTPEIKTSLRSETIGADAKVFDGLATRKQIRIRLLESDDAPWIDLLLYVPNNTSGPAPVFLGLNYGNQGVHPDLGIIPSRNAVCQRGEHAHRWPLGALLKRGYAVASFHGGDVELDRHGSGCRFTTEGWQQGIGYHIRTGDHEITPYDWGRYLDFADRHLRKRRVLYKSLTKNKYGVIDRHNLEYLAGKTRDGKAEEYRDCEGNLLIRLSAKHG